MKNLKFYENEYKKAIGTPKPGNYVILPEVWIAMKWEEDNQIDFPGSKLWLDKIQAVRQEEPGLARVILAGEEMMMERMKNK